MPSADDDLLAGRYQRRRPLGSGGMGDVWLAEDLELGRLVAVKRLRVGGAGPDAELVERMLREARVVARLKHPAIVTLHDLVRVEGRPYLIMEYVDGESLADRMAREGRLPWAEVARVAADVAGALAAAHRAGIAHRDVKPANVLLDEEGHGHLADFGIARGAEDVAITRQGEIVGTVAYLPPEVARGAQADAAGDVWSLGATFFAATEGGAPFAGTSGSSNSVPAILARLLQEDAPPPHAAGAATGLVTAMLATDPAARPTAAAVSAELRRVLSTPTEAVPAPAPPPSSAPETLAVPSRGGTSSFPPPRAPTEAVPQPAPPRPERRRRRWPLLVGLLALLVAAAVVGVVVLTGQDDDPAPSADDRPGGEPASDGGSGSGSEGPAGSEGAFSVDLGVTPSGAAVSPDGSRTYVSGTEPGASQGSLVVVDNGSGEVVDTVEVGPAPLSPVVSPDGSTVYVALGDDAVGEVSAETLETRRIEVPGVPGPVRVSADGSRLYTPTDDGVVAVVDTATREVSAVPVGTRPGLVHLTPDGSTALTPDPLSGIVAVIDTATEVGVPVQVRPDPTGLQITSDGARAYVSTVSGVIVGIDIAAAEEAQRIQLPERTSRRARLRISPDDRFLWHSDPDGDVVRVIDRESGEVVQTLDVAEPGPFAVFDADGSTAYLPSTAGGYVAAVDAATYDVTELDVGGAPTAVLLPDDDQSRLFVVNDAGDGTASLDAVPLED
ncbi:hypothetical protein GCM10023340_11980 [Nocardioides marinquilinus]|uniref:non-specific serine/threonine protein kinase n=1 Tax=Nocardioides marinquilinus TaxID=1210400 RepID=A0ABP9PFN0_9ACTN